MRRGDSTVECWARVGVRVGVRCRAISALLAVLLVAIPALGQRGFQYHGDPIPPEIEAMYVRGLSYLVATQTDAGTWAGSRGNEAGVVGIAVLAMLAHGDDPNYGPYSVQIKRGVNYIVSSARPDNGYIGNTMYNHGFATLALAEAYGAVDDSRIGPALEKAVELILTSQKSNGRGAWRYSPESRDADTTVSGAQVVALLAARNAGIHVPDQSIEKALQFFRACQGGDGAFGYTSASGHSAPRTAIGTLVFALSRRKQTKAFQAALRNLQATTREQAGSYLFYYMYYAAQAHFHADMKGWEKWSAKNVKLLSTTQSMDGSWSGSHGAVFSTGTALLSLAVNYRFLPIYER